jgi:hypothetical protein
MARRPFRLFSPPYLWLLCHPTLSMMPSIHVETLLRPPYIPCTGEEEFIRFLGFDFVIIWIFSCSGLVFYRRLSGLVVYRLAILSLYDRFCLFWTRCTRSGSLVMIGDQDWNGIGGFTCIYVMLRWDMVIFEISFSCLTLRSIVSPVK